MKKPKLHACKTGNIYERRIQTMNTRFKNMQKLLSMLIAALFCTATFAQQQSTPNPNPQKDPDVKRGYDQHQQEYKDRQNQQHNENYTVHTTGEGHGGVPTSGGFKSSEVKKNEESKKTEPKK
jgi:Ni/Co efflux regulator RcnB